VRSAARRAAHQIREKILQKQYLHWANEASGTLSKPASAVSGIHSPLMNSELCLNSGGKAML